MKNGRAQLLVRAAEVLSAVAGEVRLIATNGPRTAGWLARQAIQNGAELIIAAGGDGTISEVVNGLANSHVPLGILPGGTANVLAHEIGLSLNTSDAARQLADCVPHRVSLGQIETSSGENRYFLLMAGAGFDAKVIYDLSADWKDKLGKLSYFLGGLQRMGAGLSELEATVDGQAHRCSFALISKVRNYGGDFEIASEVQLSDNSFEVVLFEGRNSWRYLRYLWGVTTRHLERTPGVSFIRADCVELRPIDEGIYLQADGEMIGRLPATIRIVSDALTILLPKQKRTAPGERRQGLTSVGVG